MGVLGGGVVGVGLGLGLGLGFLTAIFFGAGFGGADFTAFLAVFFAGTAIFFTAFLAGAAFLGGAALAAFLAAFLTAFLVAIVFLSPVVWLSSDSPRSGV